MSIQESSEFDKKLDVKLEILVKCQNDHNVDSCSKCEHYIGCDTRKQYVLSVYESMSKGEIGGFEF
jgi:hypothetical protein